MNFDEFFINLDKKLDFKFLKIVSKGKNTDFTYTDLKINISKFLNFYQENNIGEGDLVVIILKESLDLYGSFIAAILYGALPAFYAYPSPKQLPELFIERFNDLAINNNIKLVLSYAEVSNLLRQNSKENKYDIINISDINHNNNFFFNKKNKNKFFLQFSSGTTAHKKGIKISELSLLNQIKAYGNHVRFNEKSKVASWLPHYHDMGLIACMLMPLLKQTQIIMFSPFEWVTNPGEFLEKISKYKCTHTWQPNFALGHMVKSIPLEKVKNYDLSSLEYIACSSEPILYETVSSFLNHFENSKLNRSSLQNCYGMAENTIYMSASKNRNINFLSIDYEELKNKSEVIEKPNGYKIASVGTPLNNNYIIIFDENKRELNDGKVGNIFIKSDSLFEGYYNNQKLTDESFYDGWFNTGDLGFKYKKEFYVTGRKKEIIIVGGENIYPQDIESILNNAGGFIEGRNVSFGVHDERVGTEKIVIIAEIFDLNRPIDVNEVKKKIFNALNVSISDVLLLPHKSLAKSTAGKISRYINKEKYLNGEFDKFKNSSTLPNNIANRADILIDIIKKTSVNSENIGINENTQLFNTGIIDSFGFTDLILEVENVFNIKVPNSFQDYDHFSSISNIINTLDNLGSGNSYIKKIIINKDHSESTSTLDHKKDIKSQIYQDNNEIEEYTKDNYFNSLRKSLIKVILHFNFIIPNFINIHLLNKSGMKIGKKTFFGNGSEFKIRGKLSNILIGENVKIGKNFSIRNRENGKIIIHDNCYIDDNVRIIAARNGIVEISEGTSIGKNTIINSGGEFKCGQFCLISSNVNINTSEHENASNKYIKMQQYKHGKIHLEDDVFIGSGVSILMNTFLRRGVMVSSNSLISGDTQSFSIYAGVPAKFIRKR